MKIYKIELENYRQYNGEHTIELSTDDAKNINIILGENKTGKTNLMNAINWCLYGKEPSLEKTKIELQQCIANEKELAEQEQVLVRVDVWIGDEKPEYRFGRTMRIVGTPKDFKEQEKSGRPPQHGN